MIADLPLELPSFASDCEPEYRSELVVDSHPAHHPFPSPDDPFQGDDAEAMDCTEERHRESVHLQFPI